MMTNFYQWLAGKLPRGLVYFAAVRLIAHASCTVYSNQHVDAISPVDCLKAWNYE